MVRGVLTPCTRSACFGRDPPGSATSSVFVLSLHRDGLLRTWTADLLHSASSYGLRYVSVSSRPSSSIANDDDPSRFIPAALDPSKRSPHQAACFVSPQPIAFLSFRATSSSFFQVLLLPGLLVSRSLLLCSSIAGLPQILQTEVCWDRTRS